MSVTILDVCAVSCRVGNGVKGRAEGDDGDEEREEKEKKQPSNLLLQAIYAFHCNAMHA